MEGDYLRKKNNVQAEEIKYCVDLSNGYCVKEVSGYARLVADILKMDSQFVVYSMDEELIDFSLDESLSPFEAELTRAFYKLPSSNKTIDQIVIENNIKDSKGMNALLKRKDIIINKLNRGSKCRWLQLLKGMIVDEKIVHEVAPDLFLHEAFETQGYTEEVNYTSYNQKKLALVYEVFNQAIKSLEYSEKIDYAIEAQKIRHRIHNSILDCCHKEILFEAIDERVHEIAEQNEIAIIQYFGNRIRGLERNDFYEQRMKSLRKDIWLSGLRGEGKDFLLKQLPEESKEYNTFEEFREFIMTQVMFPQRELKVSKLNDKYDPISTVGLKTLGDIIRFSKNQLPNWGIANRADYFLLKLDKLGYVIPEYESCSIEEYNQDLINADNVHNVLKLINESEFGDEQKSELLDMVFKEKMHMLEEKYAQLAEKISRLRSICQKYEFMESERFSCDIYRKKMAQAKQQMDKINEQLKMISR